VRILTSFRSPKDNHDLQTDQWIFINWRLYFHILAVQIHSIMIRFQRDFM
jgi:hypothetical protein